MIVPMSQWADSIFENKQITFSRHLISSSLLQILFTTYILYVDEATSWNFWGVLEKPFPEVSPVAFFYGILCIFGKSIHLSLINYPKYAEY